MEAPHSHIPQPVANISAFENGRNQTISHANILNSQGNITFINWNPPEKSTLLDRLLKALANFVKPEKSTPAATELPRNISSSANGVVISPEEHYDSRTARSDEDNIHLIRSHEKRFLPDTLSQAPISRSNYVKSLYPLGYGYPLWFPQLDHNLPLEYRRNGISVGDVGVIGSDGSFDFLFNIWLSNNDPINPNDLPKSFNDIARPHRRTTCQTSFNPGHSTISNLAHTSSSDRSTGEILINCNDGGEGAIIAIPHGASEEDLKNERDIMQLISQHTTDWYRYAHHKRGVDIVRHSLYLVTGCMKTTTWGIATFDRPVQKRNSLITVEKVSDMLPLTSYHWVKSDGATTFRTGPKLYPGFDPENLESAGSTENQCLFLRGFKIVLSKRWRHEVIQKHLNSVRLFTPSRPSIRLAIPTASTPLQFPFSCRRPSSAAPRRKPHPKDHTDQSSGILPSSVQTPNKSRISLHLDKQLSSGKNKIPMNKSLACSNFTTKNDVHPSDALNDLMLSQVPEAGIAITHDKIWNELVSDAD